VRVDEGEAEANCKARHGKARQGKAKKGLIQSRGRGRGVMRRDGSMVSGGKWSKE